MESRKFTAENTRLAFQMVKNELGSDAVIVSNKTMPSGVEIVARMSPTDKVQSFIKPDNQHPEKSSFDENSIRRNTVREIRRGDFDDLKRQITDELNAIKIGSWKDRDTSQYRVFRKLLEIGFSVKLVSRIVSNMSDERDDALLEKDALQEIVWSINTGLNVQQTIDRLSGTFMFHGPTGAGKTTTVAKIVAHSALRQDKEIVMVSLDNKRMGGYAQLSGYGKTLDVPVLHAQSEVELYDILAAVQSKKLVLIDNAGVVPDDLGTIVKKNYFCANNFNINHYLVIPVTTQSNVTKRYLSASWKRFLSGIVLTKADEASQLGECISCLIDSHLPAKIISSGRNIHRNLEIIDAEKLVGDALALWDQAGGVSQEGLCLSAKTLLHKELGFIH